MGSATTVPSFSTGLQLWASPSNGVAAVEAIFANTTAAFSGSLLPFTVGVLLPPVALVGLLLFALGQGGKK